MADYYKCRETITNGIVSGQEKPGHVVSVYHPYDKKMVSACIVSLDTTMSGTLKSEMAALVGFLPPQPESSEYFDERVILTGSGEWTVPEGVTSYTRVLVGGGQGGKCGKAGALPTSKVSTQTETRENESHTWTVNYKGFLAKTCLPQRAARQARPARAARYSWKPCRTPYLDQRFPILAARAARVLRMPKTAMKRGTLAERPQWADRRATAAQVTRAVTPTP